VNSENTLRDGEMKRMSLFIWFRPGHSVFVEQVTRRQECCFTVEFLFVVCKKGKRSLLLLCLNGSP
jgi:hypothetical protein